MYKLSKISVVKVVKSLVAISLTLFVIIAQIYLPSSSHGSDLGKTYLYQTVSSSGAFCTSGVAACTSGLFPTCTNSSFTPTCLPGFVSSIECCKKNSFSLDCRKDIGVFCSTTPPAISSSSSSSSSGTSAFVCSSGQVTCASTSGLVVSCSDVSFTPKCLPGANPIIECCKETKNSLSCRNDLAISCSVPSSSSSSGVTSSPTPFCIEEEVFCTDGAVAFCKGAGYKPTCLDAFPEAFPDCCIDTGFSLDCRPDFIACAVTDEELSVDSFQPIEIDVISTPEFPGVIDIPLLADDLSGKIGFAYIGSNPSFEIKLPFGDMEIEVISVDLKDSKNFVFRNIPFTVTSVPGAPEKLILSLDIPDSIAKGQIVFSLNLSDGTRLNGLIQTVDPFEVNILKDDGISTVPVLAPTINRVAIIKSKKNKKQITFKLRGSNFIGENYFITRNEELEFIEDPSGNPNTFVSIYPSSIFTKILSRTLSESKKVLKIETELSEPITTETKGVIVVSTARGLVSESFNIKVPEENKKIKFTKSLPITCFMSKPLCENGANALCTNSSFKPTCLPGAPRVPDCCKIQAGIEFSFVEEEDKSLRCNPGLLICPF